LGCRIKITVTAEILSKNKQVRTYYGPGSGTDVVRARWASGQPADAASGGMTSWPPSWTYDVISKKSWLR